MNRLTANGGMASVIHKPIAKNIKKSTYNWESVNWGSLIRKVNAKATTADPKKERIAFLLFFFSSATVIGSFILKQFK